MRQCPWIFQAPTMSAAIGTKNKMRTRVERREKGSDRLPPYQRLRWFPRLSSCNCTQPVIGEDSKGVEPKSAVTTRP